MHFQERRNRETFVSSCLPRRETETKRLSPFLARVYRERRTAMHSFLSSDRGGPSTSATAAGSSTSKSRRNHPYEKHDRAENTLALSTPKTSHDSNKLNDQSNKVIDEGKRLIVGSVEQVTRWSQMLSSLEPTKIIYQVFGIMDSVKTGSNKCEKVFCLHSEHKKSGIVCVFYEIDRKFPSIHKGTLVLCTGHVKGKNKLQIFTIRKLDENDKNSFDRISLVSQWTINDILIYKKV